jgi:hypothetical protein
MEQKKNYTISISNNMVQEEPVKYGFVAKSEEEKLTEDIFRPDIEKLQLFTHMLRRNASLNKAVITHTK